MSRTLVKWLSWPSTAIFSFFLSFRDTKRDTLSPCAPKTRKWAQSTELGIENGSFYTDLCALDLWLAVHIFATLSADESQEGRNSCRLLRSCSSHVSISKCPSRSISLTVFAYFFSFYRFLSLALFSVFFESILLGSKHKHNQKL